jgi:DNA-binding XRE family transcriptional regulator
MKARIIRIMETEALTPARFAEAIGTQRATLSHILSGRNNPSLEITQKILERFPRLSPDWLLRGAGDMYRKEKSLLQQDLFAPLPHHEEKTATPLPHHEEKAATPLPHHEEQTATLPHHNEQTVPPTPPVRNENENEQVQTQVQTSPQRPSRRVTRIMIFYSDSTYDTFISEQSPDLP